MTHIGHIPASIHPQGCQVCGFPAELDYFLSVSVGEKTKKKSDVRGLGLGRAIA